VRQDTFKTFCERLLKRLKGASRIAIVGIGDELLPFDRLGMIAAREAGKLHLPGTRVFLAGTMPESITGPLREFHPDHVLMIDAADMGTPPGTVAVIQPGRIRANLYSTHNLPLTAVMQFIAWDIGTKVTLVGIQPETTEASTEISGHERDAIERLLSAISSAISRMPDNEAPKIP
jgi:hydrogenase 3 maturation protease